ncbi:MAG TPA: RDD family protein [Terriglobales bacterium]|nr:RDD family protein [Terriglobales bacterium]
MACPLCGEVCHCSFISSASSGAARGASSTVLVDPERYDSSEEQFAASLPGSTVGDAGGPPRGKTLSGIERIAQEMDDPNFTGPDPFYRSWREEVTSRVNNYRARRRRGYDPESSLSFPFDTRPAPPPPAPPIRPRPRVTRHLDVIAPAPETKVITFPKPEPKPDPPTDLLPFTADELAGPAPEVPRILDAPELGPQVVVPQLPAITLEAAEESAKDDDVTLNAAALVNRAYAAVIDAGIVMIAAVVFAGIVVKITGGVPEARVTIPAALAVTTMLWALYQYLFLVHAATTPGLDLAGLEPCNFAGQPLDASARRYRALAMIIAALPAGLGFVWALLDEDTLGWHDRISRSYMVQR